MALKNLSPMFQTEDLDGTVRFYCDTLGFECVANDKTLGGASVRKDDVEIMFALPNAHAPFDKPNFTGSIYIFTDDVNQIWDSVQNGAKVCYPIEDFPYGMREFAIFDNNGYMLQFGQEIKP